MWWLTQGDARDGVAARRLRGDRNLLCGARDVTSISRQTSTGFAGSRVSTVRFDARGATARTSLVAAAIAMAIAAAGAVEVATNSAIRPAAVAYPCEIALGLVLWWRRRYPFVTLTAVALLATVEALAGVPVDQPWVPLAAYMLAPYSVVTRSEGDRAFAGVGIIVVAVAVQVIDQHKGLGNFIFAVAFLTPIAVAGRAVRARTMHTQTLLREQADREQAALHAERRRIPRELHDVISHSLGVMGLQAGAAEKVLETDPGRARAVLGSIRETGQEAIGELTTLLALARGEVEASREPQPALADLDGLAARTREAGLDVQLHIEGEPRPLPAALELSAYRVIQEGLTNALKHARSARAHVVLRYGEHELEVEVRDDGTSAEHGSGARRGLAGISERVALFGGRFEAGPHHARGWRLRAVFPVPQ